MIGIARLTLVKTDDESNLTWLLDRGYNAPKLPQKRGGILADKDEETWLTIEDIYERLDKKVPIDSIRQWIRSGRLPAFKPGKAYLIRRSDFEKFLKDSQTGQDQEED